MIVFRGWVKSPVVYSIFTHAEGQFYLLIIIIVDKIDIKERKWRKVKLFAKVYV